MNRFFTFFLLFITYFSFNSAAQNNSLTNSDRFVQLASKSDATAIPDSINVILKEFAFRNNYNEASVLKNATMLKPLFNFSLSALDRVYAADYLLKLYSKPMSLIPLYLIEGIKTKIVIQNK